MARANVQMYSSRHYEIGHLSNNGGLCFYDDGDKTLAEVRQFIDDSNTRVTERGYKAEQYCINNVECCTIYDENGYFLRRSVVTTRVEIYPAVLEV